MIQENRLQSFNPPDLTRLTPANFKTGVPGTSERRRYSSPQPGQRALPGTALFPPGKRYPAPTQSFQLLARRTLTAYPGRQPRNYGHESCAMRNILQLLRKPSVRRPRKDYIRLWLRWACWAYFSWRGGADALPRLRVEATLTGSEQPSRRCRGSLPCRHPRWCRG